MAGKATVELNWSEVCILLRAATQEWLNWETTATIQERDGWRDAKEKDRVLTYQHESRELVKKLTKAKEDLFDV